MIYFLKLSNHLLFLYYLLSNLGYLLMLAVALKTSAAHLRRLESLPFDWIKRYPMVPPITILVRAQIDIAPPLVIVDK
jgi:hypothetical protein